MKLVSLTPPNLTKLFEVLKDTVTDAYLHFDPNGIEIRNGSENQLDLTLVSLTGNTLDTYECASYIPVSVNFPKLWAILQMAKSEDILALFMIRASTRAFM